MRIFLRVGLRAGLGLGVLLAATYGHAGPRVAGTPNVRADPRVAALEPVPSDHGELGPPGLTRRTEDPPPVERPVAEPPATDLLARARDGDASSDRAFGRSTAIALRPGQFDFSLRTAVEQGSMLSIAAGLGHGVELSVDAGYARQLGSDYGAGIKLVLAEHATWAFAIDAGLHSMHIAGDSGAIFSADLKVTHCALDCGMLFTAGVGLAAAAVSDGEAPPLPFFELSMVFGTGPIRPLLEGLTLAGAANFGFAGVRFGGRHVAIDAGLGLGGSLDSGGDAGKAMMVGLAVRP